MSHPTHSNQQTQQRLAQKHGFSLEAVQAMHRAIQAGGGGMAQFDHPEFSGAGQWMKGGMVMLSSMSDTALKGRVDALCNDLSQILSDPTNEAQPHGGDQNSSSAKQATSSQSTSSWWPGNLGSPDSSGAQNDMRYACFNAHHRLAVDAGGKITVYDTQDHRIQGVSQSQSNGSSIRFQSQHGQVDLAQLPVVSNH